MEEELELTVAENLGKQNAILLAGLVDEEDVENVDETKFLINDNNGRTLGFSGDKEVKYADVVRGSKGDHEVSTSWRRTRLTDKTTVLDSRTRTETIP